MFPTRTLLMGRDFLFFYVVPSSGLSPGEKSDNEAGEMASDMPGKLAFLVLKKKKYERFLSILRFRSKKGNPPEEGRLLLLLLLLVSCLLYTSPSPRD